MNKLEIRKILKDKRNSLNLSTVNNLSSIITNKLIDFLSTYKAETYFIYNSFNNEVKTEKIIDYLLANNKNVYLPRVSNDIIHAIKYNKQSQMDINKFSISEPIGSPCDIDNFICIIPLIGVDKNGNRIGFGKGYYDRFLKGKHCLKIGICYDFQIVDNQIETNKTDIPLDIIMSEKRIIKTN